MSVLIATFTFNLVNQIVQSNEINHPYLSPLLPRKRRPHPVFFSTTSAGGGVVGGVSDGCNGVGGLRCWRDMDLGLNCIDGCEGADVIWSEVFNCNQLIIISN
ncbi:hypothetical protein Hanom_Chr04g00330791 [Helianthus anomalus]